MADAGLILFVMAGVLFYLAYRRKDNSHVKGVKTGWKMLVNVTPVLFLAFYLSGLIEVIIPADAISSWLGDEAGWIGLFIGPAIGALVQGGPFAFFPMFSAVFQPSVGVGTAVAMITGWSMINVGHLPYEFGFLGPRFVLLKLAVCIGIPPLAGFLAYVLF